MHVLRRYTWVYYFPIWEVKQIAYVAIWKGITNFDPSKGYQLRTFIMHIFVRDLVTEISLYHIGVKINDFYKLLRRIDKKKYLNEIEEPFYRNEHKEEYLLAKLIDHLNGFDKEVAIMHFHLGLSMRQIGRMHGVSAQAISQRMTRILNKARRLHK